MPRKPSLAFLLKRAETLAHKKFGFKELSPGQRDALCCLLGGHDTLAVLPTGGGKSAIYQIAGLVRGGLTIVVSPLVALQRDQMEHLRALKIEGHQLNSALSPVEREGVWAALGKAKSAFLLLAPEQFSNRDTLERLQGLKPSLFVVDEAHCVSSWGHDFRPDFAQLGLVIEVLGSPPVLALTATAAPPVRSDILEKLKLREAKVVVAGFDRPNLRLEVRHFQRCEKKWEAVVEAAISGEKPAIVYCATRRETEGLADELRERGQKALAYHAGLSKTERDERQGAFMKGDADLLVATVAFGMGVDKRDVRCVYHLDVSESLDSYFQEVGRGGRDGERAQGVLFFCEGDLGLRRFQMGWGEGTIKTATWLAAALSDMKATRVEDVESELEMSHAARRRGLNQLEEAGALSLGSDGTLALRPHLDLRVLKRELHSKGARAHDWEKSRLEMLRQYATTSGCRRQLLLGYFGEEMPNPCGNCDNCERAAQVSSEDLKKETVEVNRLPVGARVRHRSWGEGDVMREDADSFTVVFESVGYKTLARNVVIENGLLEVVR